MTEFKPLGPLMGHCFHLVRERLDARLAQYDVTPAQIHVLRYLYKCGGQAVQCDVTAHLKVKPSTANGILNRMEEKDLLQRTISDADARKRLITLTEKGRSQQETFHQIFTEAETRMVTGMTEEEIAQLHELLQRVMTNLEEDRGL